MIIQGNFVDLFQRKIFPAEVTVRDGKIFSVREIPSAPGPYILPGFVDAHVHIESSMLVPSEFARLAVVHGTVATVSDPHEIANVLGMEGVRYMVENGKTVNFKFHFGASSCVPATNFETAGARLGVTEVVELLQNDDIFYLSEMMNYPGVLFDDAEVLAKIAAAKKAGKPVDGHAPGVRGEAAAKYFSAGISTDHECFTYEEGLEKARLGVKILIREGSAAKNFNALIDLLPQFPQQIMFCSDDKHPDDLLVGHINQLAARAVAHGCDVFDVLRATCIHPVEHYRLPVGLLREGDEADFIVVESLREFRVLETYIRGSLVAKEGKSFLKSQSAARPNKFNCLPKSPGDFVLPVQDDTVRVIEALDGEIVTRSFFAKAKIENDLAVADVGNDILKIAVVNRYFDAPVAAALIKGFRLKDGALASCVAHDSHNIVAVGVTDEAICDAVNAVIANRGGISAVGTKKCLSLALPVAGIMTTADGYEVAQQYKELDIFVKKELGCTLGAPFMTLSFMALLVIPELKLSDKGLFDGSAFKFVSLFSETNG